MNGVVRMKFAKKLECAVQVIDDFTGKSISGSGVTVRTPDWNGCQAVRKNDHFYIFLQREVPLQNIIVEGLGYTEEQISVDTAQLDPLKPVVKIRLRPGLAYRFPTGVTGISGKVKPKSKLELFCMNGDANLSPVLLRDYENKKGEDNRSIHLFSAEREPLEGKCFAIFSKDKEEPERLTVCEAGSEQGNYHLKSPLSAVYKKGIAQIFPIYNCLADQEGNYILPIKSAVGERCQCRLSLDEGPWQEFEIETEKFTVKNF